MSTGSKFEYLFVLYADYAVMIRGNLMSACVNVSFILSCSVVM